MDAEEQLLHRAYIRHERLRRVRAFAVAGAIVAGVFAFARSATSADPVSSLAEARRIDPVAAADRQRCIEKHMAEPDAIRTCAKQFPDRNEPEEGVSTSHGLPR